MIIKSIISVAVYLFMIFGQDFLYAQSQLNIIGRITAEDGLINEGVKYIMKDSEGFMWFTYASGFNRWDGYQARNFTEYMADTNMNSSYRYCRPILEDKNGNFYIGTLRNGLLKLDRKTGKYFHYVHDPEGPTSLGGDGIHEMMLDDTGFIWLGTFVKGLSRFDPRTGTFRNYLVNEKISYPWDCNNVRSLYKDSYGIFWVGTSNGLFQFDEEEELFIKVTVKPDIVEYRNCFDCILEDHYGNMWFGTTWGIYRFDRKTGKWDHILTNDPDKKDADLDTYICSIAEQYDYNSHKLWLGTQAGLKVYDIKTGVVTHFTPHNGYPEVTNSGPVKYLYKDNDNILWAALGGITIIDLNESRIQLFELKTFPDSVSNAQASCFYEDPAGNYWIGTARDGIYHFNENLEFIANYKACNWDPQNPGKGYNNSVSQIYEDRFQRIWVLTGPTGLCLFDRSSGTFKYMNIDLGGNTLHEIVMDAYGIIWLATHNGLFQGEMTEDQDMRISLYDNPTMPRVPIDNLLSDSHHRLWIITRSSGVYCLKPENRDSMIFKRYLHDKYRHRFTIEFNTRSMIEDDWGDIWFRSERGLYRYDPVLDSIVPADHFNINYSDYNFAFNRDKNGIFWFVTESGLLQFDPSDTSRTAVRIMDYMSGLPVNGLVRNTFYRDSKGYLLQGGTMATFSGFFRFHPDSIRGPNKKAPPVVLTNFSVRNQTFPLDIEITYLKHIELKYNQNFFSFEFAAMNYFGPGKNQYAYRLEGLDEDWIYSGNRRYANYTGVPPGNYIFRVKGSNNDGYWNETGASVSLRVLKPPWKAWWADSLYAVFILAVIILISRFYLKRQQLRHALEIEHLQKEQLTEMDRMKSRFFANISHEFRTPLTLILGPVTRLISKTTDPADLEDLTIMQRNARRLQRLIDQLLGLSRIEASQMKLRTTEMNLVSFVRGYLQSFESAARQKGISVVFNADLPEIKAYIDMDKMEKVLYNLFSNALKFTPEGGRIEVSVGQLDSWTVISVSDTGAGISPEHLPFIFDRFYQADDSDSRFQEGSGIGLALAKELVELHHGKIHVESTPGKGTRFTIILLTGKDHLEEEEILPDGSATEYFSEKSDLLIDEEIAGRTTNDLQVIDKSLAQLDERPVILLIEDNADMRYYIRSFLMNDYRVVEADDGVEGWKTALKHIPDLVVSDVMMPHMDGYEFCKKLKSDERTSHIPVILLTAKAEFVDKLTGLETGADDFITKPLQPSELMARIKNLILQRQTLRVKYRREFEHISLRPENSMTSVDAMFMERARKVVEQKLTDPDFNIQSFSSQMNMSRVQLHRKLHGLFNLSASEFIRTYRLNAAARLLESRAGNVAQVAYEVGFNNLSYFSKCFQKQFGMKPSEFVKGARG
jgi:signal transduction histidine kinase/DNA-binding response OmpR family regulator/ligand-binding sensor domain-containing protein